MPRKTKPRDRPGSVRIIGGEWRRRRLALPPGTSVRPTPDRVRETLFNWLGPEISGSTCLDLFAGSGVLGFEALSRGARHVTLVERDVELAAGLARNAEMLEARAAVVRADALTFLETAGSARFDIAFVDPPFERPVEPILDALVPLMARGGLVYVERAAAQGLPSRAGLRWRREGRAGAVSYGIAEPGAASV